MNRLLIWIGSGVVVISLLLLSPVSDLLPIDFAAWISQGFSFKSTEHVFFRVVPSSDESHLPQIILIVLVCIGVALILAGRKLGPRKPK